MPVQTDDGPRPGRVPNRQRAQAARNELARPTRERLAAESRALGQPVKLYDLIRQGSPFHQNQYNRPQAAPQAAARQSSSGSSGRGRSYGGGGGGGAPAVDPKAVALDQLRYLIDLAKSPMYTHTPDDVLRGKVTTAGANDKAYAAKTYGDARTAVDSINATNPFAALQARAAQTAPTHSALLRAQGGDASAYQSEVDSLNQMAQLMASNWQNAFDSQEANFTRGAQSQQSELAQAAAFSEREIDAATRGMLGQVDAKDAADKTAKQQALLQLLLQMTNIAAPVGLSLPTMEQVGLA
jgi:hypothetical protein